MNTLPKRVRIVEVGPRDGLQMESRFVPTDFKIELIEALADGGLREIEATSFVHPKVIPQMADAAEVMAAIRHREDVRLIALVPNLKGAERAFAAGAGDVRLVVCATESYNQRNVGLTLGESADRFAEIAERAAARGGTASVVFGVALGCPIDGDVPVDHVRDLVARFVGLGAAEIGIADSYGVSNPRAVAQMIRAVRPVLDDRPLWLHLHDTRGMGLANALAAMEEGVDCFDTAFGGLGGTPIMKGASGNIATEDFALMCHEMGIETGVDLDAVRAVSRRIQDFLGRKLPSHVLDAGTFAELRALNRDDAAPVAPEGLRKPR